MKKLNLDDIQELIKFVAKSGATEVDLEIDNIKISIKSPPKKKRGQIEDVQLVQQNTNQVIPVPNQTIPVQNTTGINENTHSDNETKEVVKSENEDKYLTIKASMIGTFYRSPSPDKPEFVNVGDKITEGDTICVIEAMKLFNEIESEISGTVIKVLVDDASPIEFDQPLFLIDPS